jgi:hypothetical protein
MSALRPGRLWYALAGLAFLFATVMPTLASAHGQVAAMAPCAAEQTQPGSMLDCNDHTTKALNCKLALCAAVAIVTTSPMSRDAQVSRTITFPPARPLQIFGATLPPDPFPPKTLNSV